MFLSTMLLAAGIAAPFPPAGEYRYTGTMNGQNIGSWSVNVTTDNSQISVAEDSSAALMGMQVSATATLLLGPDLAPVRYRGTYRTPTQSPHVSVDLTATSAAVRAAVVNWPQQLALAQNTRHFVVVEPGLLAGLFVLPAQFKAWNDASVTWITPASGQAQPLSASTNPPTAKPAGVPAADAALAFDRPIQIVVWYDPASNVPDQIDVPSQNAVLTRIR